MRILMVTAEYAPLAKVGGLGDMTAALCNQLVARGHDVRVVLPLYGDIARGRGGARRLVEFPPFLLRIGQKVTQGTLYVMEDQPAVVRVYLAENESLFGKPGIYGDPDGRPHANGLARLVFHTQAALSLPSILGWEPHVLHCHDAQAALAILYLKHWFREVPCWYQARSLLTVHNLAYQEAHPLGAMAVIGLPEAMGKFPGSLEFHGQLNLLKAGIMEADLVNTVSPTYAREVISDPQLGYGLGMILQARGDAFTGVLNGADLTAWNPASDPHLAARYDASDLSGKRRCRDDLLSAVGLANGRRPLVGMVSRLVEQKGVDLVMASLDWLVQEGFALVLLGKGEERFEAGLRKAASRHPDQVVYFEAFDEALAHRILAGSDMFLVPSLYEPCGLTQMYALKYGAVPVVRHTGGLADTVRDASRPDGTGFVFHEYTPVALQTAMSRALAAWRDHTAWLSLVQRGMAKDFSWQESAGAYENLYTLLLESEEEPT